MRGATPALSVKVATLHQLPLLDDAVAVAVRDRVRTGRHGARAGLPAQAPLDVLAVDLDRHPLNDGGDGLLGPLVLLVHYDPRSRHPERLAQVGPQHVDHGRGFPRVTQECGDQAARVARERVVALGVIYGTEVVREGPLELSLGLDVQEHHRPIRHGCPLQLRQLDVRESREGVARLVPPVALDELRDLQVALVGQVAPVGSDVVLVHHVDRRELPVDHDRDAERLVGVARRVVAVLAFGDTRDARVQLDPHVSTVQHPGSDRSKVATAEPLGLLASRVLVLDARVGTVLARDRGRQQLRGARLHVVTNERLLCGVERGSGGSGGVCGAGEAHQDQERGGEECRHEHRECSVVGGAAHAADDGPHGSPPAGEFGLLQGVVPAPQPFQHENPEPFGAGTGCMSMENESTSSEAVNA